MWPPVIRCPPGGRVGRFFQTIRFLAAGSPVHRSDIRAVCDPVVRADSGFRSGQGRRVRRRCAAERGSGGVGLGRNMGWAFRCARVRGGDSVPAQPASCRSGGGACAPTRVCHAVLGSVLALWPPVVGDSALYGGCGAFGPRPPPRGLSRSAGVRNGPWRRAGASRGPGPPGEARVPGSGPCRGGMAVLSAPLSGDLWRPDTKKPDIRANQDHRAFSGIPFQGYGGAEGNRTPDLLNAIQALSQLSYGPTVSRRWLGVFVVPVCRGDGGFLPFPFGSRKGKNAFSRKFFSPPGLFDFYSFSS